MHAYGCYYSPTYVLSGVSKVMMFVRIVLIIPREVGSVPVPSGVTQTKICKLGPVEAEVK